MGFYAPAQIVRDAREHGVEVRPVDVNYSDWDCTLEAAEGGYALRLGLRQIKGCAGRRRAAGRRARATAMPSRWRCGAGPGWRRRRWSRWRGPTPSARSGSTAARRCGRCRALAPRRCRCSPRRGEPEQGEEPGVALPAATLGEQVVEDYASLRLSLKRHPLALLRGRLAGEGRMPAERLATWATARQVSVAGLVLVRQRPGTANGVIFITLEDETGIANIVVWPEVFERFRRILLTASLLGSRAGCSAGDGHPRRGRAHRRRLRPARYPRLRSAVAAGDRPRRRGPSDPTPALAANRRPPGRGIRASRRRPCSPPATSIEPPPSPSTVPNTQLTREVIHLIIGILIRSSHLEKGQGMKQTAVLVVASIVFGLATAAVAPAGGGGGTVEPPSADGHQWTDDPRVIWKRQLGNLAD